MLELRALARDALVAAEVSAKLAVVAQLRALQASGGLVLDGDAVLPGIEIPGRPEVPVLVPPQRVPRRRFGTASGRAALLHALAHIEFNAINLALDAVARFHGLPAAYYWDWLKVALEEADHFQLLTAELDRPGHYYGEFPAHNGLWEQAWKTRDDVLARMALVPRLLEARGLDVTPGIQSRLRAAGAHEAADLLEIILRDEVGHVAIGNHWYRYLCAERGLDPITTFARLRADYDAPSLYPPFNTQARLAAGFVAEELAVLEQTGS